ncbi:hypothetical protein K502DRAFT_333066 [Neoconidiobolus thromboides FSU 785]|nr:hypothetical protein K502DRAFT_333066 [Neoconidiobolus thromboides FSU 785]
MYFHGGINDYMMFQSWVPKTYGSYSGAWLLFFFLGILLEGFLVFGSNLQAKWIQEAEAADITANSFGVQGNTEETLISKNKFMFFEMSSVITWGKAVILSLLRFVESTLAYFLMLVTMIYNVGLFFSVVAGHAVGVFLFSRFRSKGSIESKFDPEHEGLSSPRHSLGSGGIVRNQSTDFDTKVNPENHSGPQSSCH